MTAALILLLAQDGKVTLDDPIAEYVPRVPDGNAITLADLLTMRSGLYCYTFAPELSAQLDADPARAWTPAQVLAIAFDHPPNAPPGTAYEYCNTNYALLGLAAEKAGGSPLAEQFDRRLFGPLGMHDTTLPAAGDPSLPEPYAHGYMYGKTLYALVDEPYPADLVAAARAGTLPPIDYTHPESVRMPPRPAAPSPPPTTWRSGSGHSSPAPCSTTSSPSDGARACVPKIRTTPTANSTATASAISGSARMRRCTTTAANFPDSTPFIGFDPDNDVALVIWTNLTLSPEGKTTANALLPTVLDQVYTGLNLGWL